MKPSLVGKITTAIGIKETGTAGLDKTPVIGAVERKGNVIARVLDTSMRATAQVFVREVVSDKGSLLATDEWTGYDDLAEYPHGVSTTARTIRCRRGAH